MAYNGWVMFNGTELVNVSRTAQLAKALGINTVRVQPNSVQWIQAALGEPDYDDVTEAPWYDPDVPASAEFAGILPLDFAGLNDSSASSTPVEYIGDGGNLGRLRSSTLAIVVSGVLVASTQRGIEYGKRWADRILRGTSTKPNCAGADLTYFRYKGLDSPIVHRRNVKLTRGAVITRERSTSCAVMWWTTFTLTAGDSYEYGAPQPQFTGLGEADPGPGAVGPGVVTKGLLTLLAWQTCPDYDYSPIQDPLNPSLAAGPEMPDFLPSGWPLGPGTLFYRRWVRVAPVEPSPLNVIPIFEVSTTVEARGVKLSVYPASVANTEQCDPLFSVVLSYLPAGGTVYVDSEEKAVYFWDGGSEAVRRADGVSFSPAAGPVDWTAFNDPDGFLVTLDLPWKTDGSGQIQGDQQVRVALKFIPRSD